MTIEEAVEYLANTTDLFVTPDRSAEYEKFIDEKTKSIDFLVDVAKKLRYDIWAVIVIGESRDGEYLYRSWRGNVCKHNEVTWWATMPRKSETQLLAFQNAFIEMVEDIKRREDKVK